MAVVRPPTAEEIAEMLGVDAEKIYEVTQTHIPKAPKRVSFKVGGMGVQLMDKDKLLESHLYVGIVGWRYSRSERHLVIETGKSGGASEKQIFLGTTEGEAIGMLMRNHAKSVATALSTQRQDAKEKEATELKKLEGPYRIESMTTLRAGPELDSEKLEDLAAGDIVNCVEAKKNSAGTVRLHLEDKGWMSHKPHLLVRLDEDGNPIPKEEPKPKPMAKAKFDPSRRRHSVSVSGVSGVIGLQSGFAGLSGPGEKVFDVQQTHIKNAKTFIHLKVGGMGVTLFDGPKLLTSYLYYDLKGWTYSKTEDMFVLKVKKKDGKAVGQTIKFQTKHDEGAIIAEAMNEHAQGLAQAKKKQSQSSTDAILEEEEEEEEEESEEEEEDDIPEAGSTEVNGFYRVLNPILIRTGSEMDSSQAEPSMLDEGQVIEVTESLGLESGVIRLHFKEGWISLKPHLVKKLKNYQPEDTPEQKTVAALKACLKMYNDVVFKGEDANLKDQLISAWTDAFPSQDAAGVGDIAPSAGSADTAALHGEVEELQKTVDSQQAAFADEKSALDAKLNDAVADAETAKSNLEAAQKSATAAQAELGALRMSSGEEIAGLKAEIEDLTTALQEVESKASAPATSAMPADAEDMFAKARAADASGDKATALREFQGGVKAAMAYLATHPEHKAEVTPKLQLIMKRAQQLKAEINAAKANNENGQGSSLPPDLEAAFAGAKDADRVGNEREAIALYEGAAKSAMIYIRANPDKKSELTPILQRFIGRARELKGMLNTGE